MKCVNSSAPDGNKGAKAKEEEPKKTAAKSKAKK